jgi:hypothetical protein
MAISHIGHQDIRSLLAAVGKAEHAGWRAMSFTYDSAKNHYVAFLEAPKGRGPVGPLGCALGQQELPVDPHSDPKVTTLPGDLSAGDECRMKGGAHCILQSNGHGSFRSQVMTKYTHTKDVWHHTMLVRYVDGTYAVVWYGDGPEMSEMDHPIWHDLNADFTFDASKFFIITHMSWLGCA